MNPTSDLYAGTDQSFPASAKPFAENPDDHLREILKRCPASTYQAASQFRKTGDTQYLPTIVLGIIERYVDSELRPKLRNPPDSLCLIEDLGIDSLTMMEIVILVEDVLAITIKNEELRSLRTIGDVKQFIGSKLRDVPQTEPPSK